MCRCSSIAWRIVCGIEFHIPHHFGEHVPLHLRKRQEDVFVGEQRMLAATCFLDRAVDDALRGFAILLGEMSRSSTCTTAPPRV